MSKQTVRDFFKQFPDDDTCLKHLFDVRYGSCHECPKCGTVGKWHRLSGHKAFSCQGCGHHIHPMAGTIYEGSTTSLQMWFYAMFLFTKSRNGVSAKELQRQLGVTYKTAWRIGHKIREHMARVDGDTPLGGSGKIVEVDETFVGGYVKGGKGGKGKTILMGMVERDGEIITRTVEKRTRVELMAHIQENVKVGTEIHTDELPGYARLSHHTQYNHKSVDHSKKQYVGQLGQTTNTVEGFFMHLKRTISGTHISVSPKYLMNYSREAEFIYNRRKNQGSILTDLLYGYPKG